MANDENEVSRDIHYAQIKLGFGVCVYSRVSLSPDDVAQCASARIRQYAEKVSGVPDRIRGYTTVTRVEYGLINGYNPKISGIPTF